MPEDDSLIDPRATPTVAAFRDILRSQYRFFKDVVDRSAAQFGGAWTAEFEETLGVLFPDPDALARAARGYAMFVIDLLRRQRQFEKDRAYPAKSYAEAAAEVYFDEDYMMSEYLPGLLVSHYLWSHHYHQARFFDSAFVAQMELRAPVRFVEVGVGTGLYSRRVMERIPSSRGVGFDISPSSKAFADAHMRAFNLHDRFEIVLQDVVAETIAPSDWLICVEVLEHLEDPVRFLAALREGLAPGGRAFITAALNAPHVDHIYLYETPEEVVAQLTAAGFALEQYFVGAAYKPAQPDLPVPSVAAFIVV